MKFVYENSVTRQDALHELCALWKVEPKSFIVALNEAYGYITAEDLKALHSLPVKRSSKRDGIAVRSGDFTCDIPDTSTWVRGKDYAQADTGDDFPDEFDAVIAVEDIAFDADGVLHITKEKIEVTPDATVNPCGSIVREGDLIVSAHTRLTPELIAALAVGGHVQVRVIKPPVVAYIPTGSELVACGAYPQRGQNIEANSLMVKGMLRQWGAEVFTYPIVRDDKIALEAALDRALETADIVLINGGSSRGEEDYNSDLLQKRAAFFRHGVRAVPGRPIGMAFINDKPVVNVPGPVMAAFLCMDWLIKGLVAHYQGVPTPRRQTVHAQVAEDLKKPAAFERLIRVSLTRDDRGVLTCRPLPSSAGVPYTLRESDGMLILPIGSTGVAAGDTVSVELLRPLELIDAVCLPE